MPSLLISLHDVTPAHQQPIERALALLDRFGVRQVALFVVPDWHGCWPLERFPETVALLRERAARGAEIALHGWRHDEEGSRRTAWQSLRALGRTAREAEFLVLSAAEADRRIGRGLALLGELGLVPAGFVPPAWLARGDLLALLQAHRLQFTEDAWAVTAVASGTRRRAPCVHWSTRKAWRAAAGVVIARVRVPLERGRELLRLGIHPPDLEHRQVTDSLCWTLERLLATRRPVRYAEVVEASTPR